MYDQISACVRACMHALVLCLPVLAGREIIHILSEPREAPVLRRAPPHVRDPILFCKRAAAAESEQNRTHPAEHCPPTLFLLGWGKRGESER